MERRLEIWKTKSVRNAVVKKDCIIVHATKKYRKRRASKGLAVWIVDKYFPLVYSGKPLSNHGGASTEKPRLRR